jgi:hypothetical protein
MKAHTLLNKRSAAMALVVSAFAVGAPTLHAAVPEIISKAEPANVPCWKTVAGKAVQASHMDKIVFTLTGPLAAALPADQLALDAIVRNSKLDIKVLDDPNTVADLKGKVLDFLGAADSEVNRGNVSIKDVLYAVVCPIPKAAE